MDLTAQHPLIQKLAHRRSLWQGGLSGAGSLRVCSVAALVAVTLGVVDYFAPMDDAVRPWVLGALAVGWLIGMVIAHRRAAAFTDRQMAKEIDLLARDPRRGVEGAYELLTRYPGDRGFLQSKTIADAQLAFARVPEGACKPRRLLTRRWKEFFITLGVVVVAMLLRPSATPVVMARFLMPWNDIPPFSPLHFEVSPQNPEVIYGGGVELTAAVTGGELRHPVVLRTRNAGSEEYAPCFRATGNVFTQRIEGAVQEMEFCFASGHARSKWMPLSVLMEPRFALARCEVQPPAYTGSGVREFLLGNEPLRVPEGSQVRVTITSNRPLGSGVMRMHPDGEEPAPGPVEGALSDVHTTVFEFAPTHSGELMFTIRDVQGTSSPEPFRVRLQTLPDARPQIVLHEPPAYSLATPDVALPVSGIASDDHGLRKVSLVRTLDGRRDRSIVLEEGEVGHQLEFRSTLELGSLGVVPGEIIEIYAEGEDNNPALTGYESSSLARVEIISTTEFAEMVRSQTQLEELAAKYQEIQRQIEAVKEALKQGRKAADAATTDAEVQEKLDATQAAAQEAAEFFEKAHAEFAAFEMEEQAKDALGEMAGTMTEIAKGTSALAPTTPHLANEVRKMLEMLEQSGGELAPALQDAKKALRIAAVMEQAGLFNQLLENQRHLERLMEREAASPVPNPRLMDALAQDQKHNRKVMDQLVENIQKAAQDLDHSQPDEEKLERDAMEFARQFAECGAGASMDSAAADAGNHNAGGAHANAATAVRQLETLLRDRCEGGACSFGGMCIGLLPASTPPQMQTTLGQLLAAMLGRGSSGMLSGSGGSGSGLAGSSGYWTRGFSQLQLPILGPERMSFRTSPGGITSTESGNASGGLATQSLLDDENLARIQAAQTQEEQSGGGIADQQVPAKYRAAIRRYFTTED